MDQLALAALLLLLVGAWVWALLTHKPDRGE